jgi:hypothetical protein
VLANLTCESSSAAKTACADGLAEIVSTMDMHADEPDVLINGLITLVNVCDSTPRRRAALQAGAGRVALNSLIARSQSSSAPPLSSRAVERAQRSDRLAIECLRCLRFISLAPNAVDSGVDAAIVPMLLVLAGEPSNSPGLVAHSILAAAQAACVLKVQQAEIMAGIVRLLEDPQADLLITYAATCAAEMIASAAQPRTIPSQSLKRAVRASHAIVKEQVDRSASDTEAEEVAIRIIEVICQLVGDNVRGADSGVHPEDELSVRTLVMVIEHPTATERAKKHAFAALQHAIHRVRRLVRFVKPWLDVIKQSRPDVPADFIRTVEADFNILPVYLPSLGSFPGSEQLSAVPASIGVGVRGDVLAVIVGSGAPLPCTVNNQTFTTTIDMQESVSFSLIVGERAIAGSASNIKLGSVQISVPPLPRREAKLQLSVTVDDKARVTLSVIEMSTGEQQLLTPDTTGSLPDREQCARMHEDAQAHRSEDAAHREKATLVHDFESAAIARRRDLTAMDPTRDGHAKLAAATARAFAWIDHTKQWSAMPLEEVQAAIESMAEF